MRRRRIGTCDRTEEDEEKEEQDEEAVYRQDV